MGENRLDVEVDLRDQLVSNRRELISKAAKAGVLAAAGPALLAGCGEDEGEGGAGGGGGAQKKQIGYDFPFNNIPVYGALTKFAKEWAQLTG